MASTIQLATVEGTLNATIDEAPGGYSLALTDRNGRPIKSKLLGPAVMRRLMLTLEACKDAKQAESVLWALFGADALKHVNNDRIGLAGRTNKRRRAA